MASRAATLSVPTQPKTSNGNGHPAAPAPGNAATPASPAGSGLAIARYFTDGKQSPFEQVQWERRSALISNEKGETVFRQDDVEVPVFWSQTATNVVVSKYFNGKLGTPQRENSVRRLIDRVATTIRDWGAAGGYFAGAAEAAVFYDELVHLLVQQKLSFNSPVWFNCGIEKKPQCSACFINSVEDRMESILELAKTEGMLFKWGSGTGSNLSPLRSSREKLSSGGIASGPVSFMRGFDAFAGVIKSGGKTRRAAKMVILNADHPDIVEFINSKASEEKKAWALIDAGYDGSFNGEAYHSIFFQNANHSVRVTDEFMRAVERDGEWQTRAVTTGEVVETYRARDLMKLIAEAAWLCGDPGMQFDTTINRWHTCSNTDRIHASNPCFTGDSLVLTNKGLISFRELIERANHGEEFQVATDNQTSGGEGIRFTSPEQYMITGFNPIVRLGFSNGMEVRCTRNHRFFTQNRGMVKAAELTPADKIVVQTHAATFAAASWNMPASSDFDAYRAKGDRYAPLALPERWTEDFAELLGHLVGDGSISGNVVSWIYGSDDDKEQLLPRHSQTLKALTGEEPHVTVMENKTLQVRISRGAFKRFIVALGVKETYAANKVIPASIFQAPTPIVAAFLKGLFTADGCVVEQPNGTRYVGLGSKSKELLQGAQRLLATFGIFSRIDETKPAAGKSGLPYTRRDGSEVVYESRGPSYDLRITGRSLRVFAKQIGFATKKPSTKLIEIVERTEHYATDETINLVSCEDDGVELTYNLTEPVNHSYIVNGLVVANCSEYMFLNDTACNLASLNLMRFRHADGSFDHAAFTHAVSVAILAQEIIVDNASYPTPKIEKNSHDYRPLGLGYANLGALLMASGLPYDSDAGRAYAGLITALMHGQAYKTSALIASTMGPFPGYSRNREPMLRVIQQHAAQVDAIDQHLVPSSLFQVTKNVWAEAFDLGREFGYRNSQVTVLAPTGTIGFMMDCDTTGVEPDIALVKYKKLVGGGMIKIVNQTVPEALQKLGYSDEQRKAILEYIDRHDTIEGAPGLQEEHLPVFDCAFKPARGQRTIHYMGHVKMMAAVQPFLSGAISKTVNMPHEITPEDIAATYLQAWKMGLKAIAIYRDGCKRIQPLVTSLEESKPAKPKPAAAEKLKPVRRRLPDERQSITHKFSIAGHEGYLTVGMYEDGTPGEIFVVMAKEGSVVSGLMDSFATAISLALQYGVPLQVLVRKFQHARFEPSGFTTNPQIRMAKSITDYIFRWLALKFLPDQEIPANGHSTGMDADFGIDNAENGATGNGAVGATPADHKLAMAHASQLEHSTYQSQADAPPCHECGSVMVRSGSCYKCLECGSTSGCS